MNNTTYSTREEWLVAFAKQVEPLIRERCSLSPTPYRIACGWPSKGGRPKKHRRIGECWVQHRDGLSDIFISPTLDDVREVTETAAHELLHAFLPKDAGHRKPFSQAAKKLGLEGKPTETVAGDELWERLSAIADELGPYPHKAITPSGPTQQVRNLKFVCPECGYIGRTSAFWLDSVGPPICPQCNIQMVAGDDVEAINPLTMLDQTTEYKMKGDERFRIRMIRTTKLVSWFVLDFDAAESTPSSYFEVIPPRLTPVDSREDAIGLVEALREGLTTYEDIEVDDDPDAPNDGEGDSEVDAQDLEYLDEDESEDQDYEDSLELFAHEQDAPDYGEEQAKRESWVKAA